MNIFIPIAIGTAGEKLRKKVTDVVNGTVKMVDYLDGFQTEERGSRIPVGAIATQLSNNEQYAGGVLQFFPHSEGYVKATPGAASINSPPTSYSYNYVYNYTDHLDERIQSIALFEVCERSSVRLSYSKNPATNQLNILDEIEGRDSRIPEKRRSHLRKNDEQNHYYPFGLKHEVYISGGKRDYRAIPDDNDPRLIGVTQTDYQYKYNGKEFQDELGLGLYDYHARNYDPSLGRWNVIDPMAPKYLSHSPYAYALNNPIYFIDPDGMEVKADKNDPEKPHGRVILPGVTIVGSSSKTSKKSKSSNSSYFPGLSFTFSKIDLKSAFFGNHVDGAYRNMLSPQNKEGYLKMRQAMHEGQVGVVVLFSSVVALPYAVTYGSVAVSSIESSALISSGQTALGNVITNQKVTEFLLRFSLDIGTQAIFNGGDFKLSDVTGAAVGALPFVPWYASGFAAEGTGLGTKALFSDKPITEDQVIGAGIKSFMISPLGTASGNAMEAVTNKTAGMAIEAVHNNAQGFIIDDAIKH